MEAGEATSDISRRTFRYVPVTTIKYGPEKLPHGSSRADALKWAARDWASQSQKQMGDFRTCRERPAGLTTVAHCLQHSSCPTHWRFTWTSEAEDGHKVLEVCQANDCDNQSPRTARKRPRGRLQAGEISVQDRACVVKAMDSLATRNLAITAKSVALCILPLEVPAATLRAMVRSRRQSHGLQTSEFRESVSYFEDFARPRTDPMQFRTLSLAANAFVWVATLTPFLAALENLYKEQKFDHWCVTTDWTTRLCHMSFAYGWICAVIFRLIAGRWRRSALPLVAMCGPQENLDVYRRSRGFGVPVCVIQNYFVHTCVIFSSCPIVFNPLLSSTSEREAFLSILPSIVSSNIDSARSAGDVDSAESCLCQHRFCLLQRW